MCSAWANAWHGLGALTAGSPEYNAALEAITERFAGRNARPGPGFPNGSAINAVRTNEIDFGQNGIWELREFVLSPSTGLLVPATVKLTPDLGFNFTNTLASFINANEAAILTETHTVPEQFQERPVPRRRGVQRLLHHLAGAGHQQQRGAAQVRAEHLQRLPLDRSRASTSCRSRRASPGGARRSCRAS